MHWGGGDVAAALGSPDIVDEAEHLRAVELAGEARVEQAALLRQPLPAAELHDEVRHRHRGRALDAEDGRRVLGVARWVGTVVREGAGVAWVDATKRRPSKWAASVLSASFGALSFSL